MADQEVSHESKQSEASASARLDSEQVALPYIGQWNSLISTTNWQRGRIICLWRDAMMDSGVPVTEYSDEAWAQLVGGVTCQHVGRLRRVFQRFGEVYEQYEGLYWSHFQAAIDWDDSEMWLEGSLQNGWSVSQMRGKRWETLGVSPEEQQSANKQEVAEQNAEAVAEDSQGSALEEETEEGAGSGKADGTATSKDSIPPATTPPTTSVKSPEADVEEASPAGADKTEGETADPVLKRTRLQVDVESLPDDLAEAFESFKLAIIAHRREGWRDATPESVVECLDALKQLALAETE